MKKLIYDLPPSYNEMIVDTLYYPTNITFPFTEYFYKNNNDTLVVFQVTRQKTSPKYLLQSTFTEYLEKTDFPEDKVEDKLKLVFILGPKQVEEICLTIKKTKEKEPTNREGKPSNITVEKKTLDLIKKYTILKIDDQYNLKVEQIEKSQTNSNNSIEPENGGK